MRQAKKIRRTAETDIEMSLCLEGRGNFEGTSGVAFLDHMLTILARHAAFDIGLKAQGDLEVDAHHTVEDIGIVLGELLLEAIGDKKGINRYGDIILPMDEALIMCAVDLSGRPFLHYDLSLPTDRVGDFDTELVREFMMGLAMSAKMNLHLMLIHGENTHHIIEGAFKALARVLYQAVAPGALDIIPSSKGVL